MGWFTAKDTPSSEPVRGQTISDKEWQSIQRRAAAANPERAKFGTDEHAEAGRRGNENYRNRHRN
jgi:hypothetical protein